MQSSARKARPQRRLDPTYVKAKIEGMGFSLLSPYKKAIEHLDVECKKGHRFKRTWVGFNSAGIRSCPACLGGSSGTKSLSHEYVKGKIEAVGLKLHGTYKKASLPLSLECSMGHRFDRSWRSIDGKNAVDCPVCTGRNGARKGHTTESAKAFFLSHDYTMLSDYIGAHGKIDYRCPKGHVGSMSWTNFQSGKRCAECAGKVVSQESLAKEFKDEGYVVTSDYVPGQKVEFICPQGHRHSIGITSWRFGVRCGKCHAVTYEEVKQAFDSEGYTLLSDKYTRAKDKLKFICPDRHTHEITWDSWKRGTRCGKCQSVDPVEVRQFFSEQGYQLLNDYVNKDSRLNYICPKGHKHDTVWGSFSQASHRCPECAGQVITSDRLNKTLSRIGLTTASTYVNEVTPLKVKCEKGHETSLNWREIREGRRCRVCHPPQTGGFDVNKTAILYYIRFDFPDTSLYKIGITNLSVRERFHSEPLPYTIVKETSYLLGKCALNDEQAILKKYKKHRYTGCDRLVSGNTELFTKDVLRADL